MSELGWLQRIILARSGNNTIYKITVVNKLREFSYKLLNRIFKITDKELKQFKIRNDDVCSQCKKP